MSQGLERALARWWESGWSHVSMLGVAIETLACRAEVRPSVSHDNSLDGAAANGAEFTTSMSNLEIEMGRARFAIGTNIGINAGAFAADGCPKNPANTVM